MTFRQSVRDNAREDNTEKNKSDPAFKTINITNSLKQSIALQVLYVMFGELRGLLVSMSWKIM